MVTAARERVLVRRSDRLAAAVAEALDFLEQDFRGLRVWVKPNLISPHPPERSVTTDPELVRLVVRELRRRGAKEVIVADNPGGWLRVNIERYLAPTGIVEASEGCFRSIADATVTLPLRSRFLSELRFSRIVTETDLILVLPVFKTHAFTILSGAVKNLFGAVPGGIKGRLHTLAHNDLEFAELVVDIFQAIPTPMLFLMDAQRGMDGPGPTAGRARRIERLLAARNGVALDAVMALMCGARPDAVPMLRIAGERGLGPTRREDIDITGDYYVIPGFRLPGRALTGTVTALVARVYPIARARPLLRQERCIRCRRCADGCPVEVLTLAPWPRIDRARCISCYCCTEVCPEQALTVPGPWRGLLQNLVGR